MVSHCICLLTFLCLISRFVDAQDCRTSGQSCNDDKMCCGGCCIQGLCISTYQNCEEVQDLCMTNYCGPGFECHIYHPSPECLGCSVQRVCRPF